MTLRFTRFQPLLILVIFLFRTLSLHSQPATGLALTGGTLYPRAIRLVHGAANGRIIASTNGIIFQSTDNGASWTKLGKVPVIEGSKERCCATLFEMRQAVGSLAAGTLLSAASYFSGSIPAIEIYASSDSGSSWTYQGTPILRGNLTHGLWEPEFEIAGDGALVMFWSDETDDCCSQRLVQIRSYNGRDWVDERNTIATPVRGDRPGMITVSKLSKKHFFMTYEMCGPAHCTVYFRTSSDGWNFGDPSKIGVKIVSTKGQYLAHAPTNAWVPSAIPNKGTIIVVGQLMFERDGTISPGNGSDLFVSATVDGKSKWSTIPAPVQVPAAYDNYCPNYSSAILSAMDGSSLLELASAYDSRHACATYFGSEPLPKSLEKIER